MRRAGFDIVGKFKANRAQKTAAQEEAFRRLTANYKGPTTPLMRHGDFFDGRDGKPKDGILHTSETIAGLRDGLGMPQRWAAFAGTVINGALGPSTNGGRGSTVLIPEIAKAEHEGDAGVLDRDGRVGAGGVDHMFATYAHEGETMTAENFHTMFAERAHTAKGQLGTHLEWGLLLALAADRQVSMPDGKTVPGLGKERVNSLFSGDLFFELEEQGGAHFDSGLFSRELGRGVGMAAWVGSKNLAAGTRTKFKEAFEQARSALESFNKRT